MNEYLVGAIIALILLISIMVFSVVLIRMMSKNDYCYMEMESKGAATFGCCRGITDSRTGRPDIECADCEYFDLDVWKEENNEIHNEHP